MSLSLHTAHLLAYVALAPYGSLSRLSLRDTPLRPNGSPMSLSLHTAHLLAYVALAPYGSLSRLSLRDTPLRNKKPVGQCGE